MEAQVHKTSSREVGVCGPGDPTGARFLLRRQTGAGPQPLCGLAPGSLCPHPFLGFRTSWSMEGDGNEQKEAGRMLILHGGDGQRGGQGHIQRQVGVGDRQSNTSLADEPVGQLGMASATVTEKFLPTPREPAGLAQAQQRWHTMGMPSWEQGLHFPLQGPHGWTPRPGKRALQGPAREPAGQQLFSGHHTGPEPPPPSQGLCLLPGWALGTAS